MGLAFKKDTGEVRETPASAVCHMLQQNGANVHICDPKEKKADVWTELEDHHMDVNADRMMFESSAQAWFEAALMILIGAGSEQPDAVSSRNPELSTVH